MGLTAGIIGLPNVGKSTIFNALCSGKAAAENYPFCTIDPNHGMVAVPDERLNKITSFIQTGRVVPAFLELIDIAGLVKGASRGEGAGNQFLGHIKEVDAILHVVRVFDDPDVVHVDGAVNPESDIGIIETELILKDLDIAEKSLAKASKVKSQEKDQVLFLSALELIVSSLSSGIPIRKAGLSAEMLGSIQGLGFLTQKPVLLVANTGEDGQVNTAQLQKLADSLSGERAGYISLCGKIEAEIAELPEDERVEYLSSLGIAESGLNTLARAVYRLLGLETFFTINKKELHAWTVKAGSSAFTAAGAVHSDFQKGFICAEVYSVEDLVELGSEAAIRAAGKIRAEGRDYTVRDGDIILFRANP